MATPPVFTAGQVLTAAQMNQIGLWKITSADFTASSSVIVDNCFSADFDNYRILFRYTSTSGTTTAGLRLRAGGVNAATNYDRQGNLFSDSTLTASRSSAQTSWVLEKSDTGRATFVALDIQAPYLAANTSFVSLSTMLTTIESRFMAGIHSDTTSYDGFNVIITGGVSITGTLWVYGYR